MKCSFYRLVGGLLPTALVVGCASPGPPRAPSLRLPRVITTIHAERSAGRVILRFVAPLRTTDDEPVRAVVLAGLCRSLGDGPCEPTASFPGRVTIAGPVEWVDVLPPELATGAARKLTYRVETFNESGRSAGPSKGIDVPAGAAPMAVKGLRAEGSGRGVEVRWEADGEKGAEVLVQREVVGGAAAGAGPVETTRPEPAAKAAKGRRAGGVAGKLSVGGGKGSMEDAVWLHADGAGGQNGAPGPDKGGLLDADAKADQTYRYTAVRSRAVMVNGEKLELRSEASAPVTIALRDTYAPPSPSGVLAVSFPLSSGDGIAIDLTWQPIAETDLAGYNVYRQAQGGAVVKLTAVPVGLPGFHDATPMRGVGYRYTVTAVDRKGNESAASAAADVAATP